MYTRIFPGVSVAFEKFYLSLATPHGGSHIEIT